LTTGSIFSALCKVILLSDKPCYHEMTTSIPFLLLSVSKNNNVTSSHLICFFIFFKKLFSLFAFGFFRFIQGYSLSQNTIMMTTSFHQDETSGSQKLINTLHYHYHRYRVTVLQNYCMGHS